MFFKDEDEKAKFLAEQEKEKKKYEKIEKKLFSDISLVVKEIDENPTEELKVVLFSNKDDLCKEYFHTLPSNKDGESNFMKVFNFVFNENNKLIDIKGARFLLEDFKLYMDIAVEKRYVLGVDAIISYFENKIDILNPLNFMLMTSLEQDNYTLLEFLFLKEGEDGKKSKHAITENVFFSDCRSLSSIIKHKAFVNFNKDLYEKVMSVTPYKKIAFRKDEFVNTFISKIKVFLLESKEVKNNNDMIKFRAKTYKILDIFYGMDESTIENLVYAFEEKKEAALLFSFVSLFNKMNMNLSQSAKENIVLNMYEDPKYESLYGQFYYLQKTFLAFAKTDQKVDLINNTFANISKYYDKKQLEEINRFERKQVLMNTLEKEDNNDELRVKTKKKKI